MPNMERIVIPAMLTLARESRGWSQKELADKLGIAQATVSKYENGMLQVPEQEALRIARSMNFTVDLLYQQEQVYGLGSSFLFHRKRQSAPVSVQRRIQARIKVNLPKIGGR